MRRVYLPILLIVFFVKTGFAQQGKDGAKTIATTNVVVNEYTLLVSDAAAGSTSITVSSNALNSHNRFSAPLSAGDLIMLIQMQGATINGSATDSTWGAVTNYNNCGWNEFAQVAGVSGTTLINLKCPLNHNYTASGNVQVIRVPRFSTLTVNPNDTLTCDIWNGTTGGVVAVEVSGNTVINAGGVINASAKGFRGGIVENSASNVGTVNFFSMDDDLGSQKGESIAGYQSGYNTFGGMFCRGAAANGGGGGDSHNAAGGGGANAGDVTKWTGNGNPDITTNASWVAAWNLEYNGFANSTSSGGGRGGDTWCTNDENALTVAPGNFAWGGDLRRTVGGKGGRPLDYSIGRVFCGGGGGGGQEDNSGGGNGGNGGGIIYVISYGTISGGGSVVSDGGGGQNANCAAGAGDPPGGAGGGGTIILNSTGTISGISIFANGGKGGNQNITTNGSQPDESEGAGGGGGGGYVATSNTGITTQVLGGVNGVTNSIALTEFPPDGATKGGNGIDTSLEPFCLLQLGAITGSSPVCSGSSNTYSVPASCSNAIYTWTLPGGWSGTSTTNSITATSGTSGGTIKVSVSNGSCPLDTTIMVTVDPAPVKPDLPKDTSFCGAINLMLSAGSTGFNYLWSTGATTNSIIATDTGTYWLQVYNDCDTLRDSTTIIQKNKPKVFLGNDTSYCSNFSRLLNAGDSATAYKWSTGATTQTIIVNSDGTYWVAVTNDCGQATDSIKISGCEGGYVLPNAFTPGTDNANNLIGLLKTGSGPTTLLYFRIYSRWGQLIFSTNDDQAKWDGRFNGLPQPLGVYVYVVDYNDSFGLNKMLKGNITLLR